MESLIEESPEPPQNAAATGEELIFTEMGLRLTGLFFLGWAALIAAEKIRTYDLQLASFEAAPWTFIGGISGQLGLPLVAGASLCFLLPSARIEGNFLSVLWTFTVHLGFLPALYVLRFINSKEARRILTAEYKTIREATREQNGFWLFPFVVGVIALLGILYTIDYNRMLSR